MPDSEPSPMSIADRFRQQGEAARATAVRQSRGAHLDKITYGSWTEQRPLSAVLDSLPTFHGRTLIDIVSSSPPRSRVWDLGSGDRAVALSELVAQNPGLHIQGVGVTMPVEREKLEHPDNVDVVRMDVDEYLRIFDRSQRPNLIYMSKLLRWVAHPLSTLKKAYNALESNGILLVDKIYNYQSPLFDTEGRPVDPSALETVLKESGYDVEIVQKDKQHNGVWGVYTVAIRKTENHPHLSLPIRIVPPEQLGIDLAQDNWGTPFEGVMPDSQYLYVFDPKEARTTPSFE